MGEEALFGHDRHGQFHFNSSTEAEDTLNTLPSSKLKTGKRQQLLLQMMINQKY